MYELWQHGYGLWHQNKDAIVLVFLSIWTIWKVFNARIKGAAAWTWAGVKRMFRGKPVVLCSEAADIVMNILSAKLVPGTKILKHRQVEYHPRGVVKLEQEVYFDGLQARVSPARTVKLTAVEQKAVKQHYEERLKQEVARLESEGRAEAAQPELPKWRKTGAAILTGHSCPPVKLQ